MDLIKKGSILSTASIFLVRRKVLELLNRIEREKFLSFDDIEDIAEKIIEYGNHAIPIIIKNFSQQKDPLILSRYEYLIMTIYDTEFLKYLHSINLEDNLYLRRSVINLLNFYGENLSETEIYPLILDYFNKVKDLLDFFMEPQKDKFINSVNLIRMAYFLTDIEKLNLVQSIKLSDNENIYLLLYLLLWTGSDAFINEAIKLLGRLKTKKSLYLLQISKKILPEKYFHEISKSIKKLKFSGIDIEEKPDFLNKNYNIWTKISDLNKDSEFYLFFEIKDLDISNKLLLSITDLYFLSVNSYIYSKNESNLESIYALKKADNNFTYAMLKDVIKNHYEMGVPFPWQFTYLCLFLNNEDLTPEEYKCQINDKVEGFFNEYVYNELNNLLKDNDWLLNDIRFIEIIEKWYLNTEPYEDLWRDHLFIRKVIREIILPEIESWKKRFCQLADYLYLVGSKYKLSLIIHKVIDKLKPDIEIIEKEDLIRKIILYNKEKFLKSIGR